MSRRLIALDLLLGLLACLCAAALLREVLTPLRLPPPPALRPAPPASAPSAPVAVSVPAASSYAVIATKNLFSPTRSEAPAGPVAAAGPKPFLHGVVMDGTKSRAYLEDPALKRTFGYAVGDPIGGGHLETISPDRVTIARPEGLIEVLVQDPAKPKPTAPATAASAAPAAVTPPAVSAPTQQPAVTPPVATRPTATAPAPRPRATPAPPARINER